MAKKKRRKKVHRRVRRIERKTAEKGVVRSTKRKISLVLKNLALFAVLALASFCLYNFLNNKLFKNLFYLLAIVLGFVALAFLIVLLALAIMRLMKK